MLIKSARVENFASYKELEIDFSNNGLMLIHGPTGSGKSTICDIVPWILFGKTSKGGNADEILSWPGDKITKGECAVEGFRIVRTRGPKAKDNDLYYLELNADLAEKTRGKDLNDTQKLINNLLGIDYDLYLSGAYFHEFSQTAQFFITTAKNRRAICEQLVDLSLAKTLQTNLSEARKDLKLKINVVAQDVAMGQLNLNHYKASLYKEQEAEAKWQYQHDKALTVLQEKYNNFETNKYFNNEKLSKNYFAWNEAYDIKITKIKDQIDDLIRTVRPKEFFNQWQKRLDKIQFNHTPTTCEKCGSDTNHDFDKAFQSEVKEMSIEKTANDKIWNQIDNLKMALSYERKEENPYAAPLEQNKNSVNNYSEMLESALTKTNPYTLTAIKANEEFSSAVKRVQKYNIKLTQLKQEQSDLELLVEITETFRGELIKSTIVGLEDKTNELLTKYFDSEVQINLVVEGADKVEAIISKDSNIAAYSQLSKGQRQLLKLCFGVAVMKAVQNHHSIQFEQLFFDEVTEGFSSEFERKVFNLLSGLEMQYNSVFVVSHSSEIKDSFHNKIHVELVNGHSEITKE